MDDTLNELLDVGLLSSDHKHRGALHLNPATYIDRLRPLRVVHVSDNKTHIPLEQTNSQIENDRELLVEKPGISEETAKSLAQLAASRGCYMGYVAEVVEYATTTPGIKNPAGCAIDLIRRNERRKPASQVQRGVQEASHALDPEKYTSGKYAFLFRHHQEERDENELSPETRGSDRE